ncbi:MAG: Fic family protein, partial [Acidobacteriota bacterium]|nr:Fic family protein [Acidobacteriota bacterium]
MQRGMLGQWHVGVAGGETVRAFIPAPLPPNPPLVFDPPRQQRLEQALLALGRLDAIAALLPE